VLTNRATTALFAACEALLVVGIGIGIPLAALTVLWAFQYGLQVEWIVFWRAAVDTWLLGHGADVTITLAPKLAGSLGFPGAGTPFILTIAPLGFALITILLGVRAGRRIGETPHRLLGGVVSIMTCAVLSLAATLSALFVPVRASIWQGTLLPTLCFALGVVIGSELGRRSLGPELSAALGGFFRDWVRAWPPRLLAAVTAGLRVGLASVAGVVAVSAILLAGLLLTSYARVVTLYEGVHAGVLGGVALTIGQLAFLPNLVIWVASWLLGPGFAIGSGSSVSPFGTSLGPIPAVPVLGALPAAHEFSWGFLGLLVPVIIAFLMAVLVRRGLVTELATPPRALCLTLAGLIAGLVGGIVFGLLAWASAGAAGPGRLADVGPAPWITGAIAAAEIGVAAVVGMLAGRTTTSR